MFLTPRPSLLPFQATTWHSHTNKAVQRQCPTGESSRRVHGLITGRSDMWPESCPSTGDRLCP
jgi:hypothetical protein